MRTKGEESSMTSNARASNSPDIPSTTGSASPPIQRSEIRWYLNKNWLNSYTKSLTGHFSLQDLGDLQQLYMMLHEIWADRDAESFREMKNFLDEALSNAEQEIIMIWARRHDADGRYRDAEYLIRRADPAFHTIEFRKHMWPHLVKSTLPAMILMYKSMGDYTAEEKCQEKLVEFLFFAKSQEQVNEEQIQAIVALSRLLSNFHKRILDLVPNFGESELFITYRAAVLDVVLLNEVLLEQGLITSKTKGKHHYTSLHIAAKENAINLARRLIEMGADVNSEDVPTRTPLHLAAEHAGSEMVELLLKNKAQVEGVNDLYYTPLHVAVKGKHPQETVTSLVNAKANINAMNWYRVTTWDGATALYELTALNVAIERDLPSIASLLLEQGANVEGSSFGEAPLFTAVHYQRNWAIYLLLDHGANVFEKEREGYNVLNMAVKMDRESIVQVLLDHIQKTRSASYEEKDHEESLILHDAIEKANVSIVEMLLKARVGIHARDHGDTALHQAVREGGEPHERIVQLLLEHDAVDMQQVNLNGDTALHIATIHSHRNMLAILLSHMTDELPGLCQTRNSHGQTPLEIALLLAQDKKDSSVEVTVLCMLAEALGMSPSLINDTDGQED